MKINIKKYIDSSGLSKNELARKLDISYPTMLSLYNGEASTVRLDTLENLCILLKCTPNDILCFEKKSNVYDKQSTIIEDDCIKNPIYEALLSFDPNIEFEVIQLANGKKVAIPYLKKQNKSDTSI